MAVKMASDNAARIGEPVWIPARPGIEQQARGFDGGAAHDHDSGAGFLLLPRLAVDDRNRAGQTVLIKKDLPRESILAQREVARAPGLGKHAAGCGVNRRYIATIHAVAAVMARGTVIVSAREQRFSYGDDRNPHGRDGALQNGLAAAERQRRQIMLSGGKDLQSVVVAADADHLLDAVVIRRDVVVGDGPIGFDAVG